MSNLTQLTLEVIESLDGAKSPYGKKWLAYFPYKRKYDWNSILEDDSNINEYIDSAWKKIIPLVEKVNKAIIENSKALKECYKL